MTYWATPACSPIPAGTPVNYGYFRIQVERQVLADVVNEVYQT